MKAGGKQGSAGFFLSLFFDREDGSYMFLNIR
jgi:hypothetical protein